jgi:hypothetical protein
MHEGNGLSGGSGQSSGAGVVDEVEGLVGVSPQVDAGEGLFDRPRAEGLQAVVGVVIGA